MPLITIVTTSPGAISPPVAEPVTVIKPAASAAFTTSSAVMLSTETVPAVAPVSTVWVEVPVLSTVLPDASVEVTTTSKMVSAAKSLPATSTDQLPSACTVVV